MARAYLSLGANLANKRAAIARAVDLLADLPASRIDKRSRDYRTPPWGKTDQDWFVNAAVAIDTALAPDALLAACLGIEAQMGRERRDKWGPRLIDIDIIAYDDVHIDTPTLSLPHRHALERAFVMAPLAEIAPDLVLSGRPVRAALAVLDTTGILPMDDDAPAEPIAFDRSFNDASGLLRQVTPLVRRIVVPNPGPFTFTGTCSYVLGSGEVTVIDPGPEDAAHITSLLEQLGSERVTRILVTHTHRDHSPGAALLKAATGAPIIGCGPHISARALHEGEVRLDAGGDRAYRPDLILSDGDIVRGEGFTLTAVATPGHTANHLAFSLAEENALFSGDHVMAWSTTVVAPPDGSMGDFMQSLDRLKGRDEQIYWPGHGGPVTEPKRFVRALIHHRRMREASIINRVRAGDATIQQLVETVYEGLDPRLKGGAALSLLAHLEDLTARGLVLSDGPATLTGRFTAA